MSTRADKLAEFERAWRDADRNFKQDIAAAAGDTQLEHGVESNWWRHQSNWAMAATAALEKTTADVEAAFEKARAANQAITDARARAAKIPAIIRASAKAATAFADLLKRVA